MTRPTRDQWGLDIAKVTAKRATCLRRSVGCVLVDARGHVLATGYNGVSAGAKHCNEAVSVPKDYKPWGKIVEIEGKLIQPERPSRFEIEYPYACPGAYSPSGTNLDACQAIHAEQNALMQCKSVWDIHTTYVTVSACMTCVKLLLNTICSRIVFGEEYVHADARSMWLNAGREWVFLSPDSYT